MELKGAFKYLIQVISDYIQDKELLSQLHELQSLIDDKSIKDIELKKFILNMGSKVNQISKTSNTHTSQHCKTNSLQENLVLGSKVQQRVLQPISLNTVFSNVPINHEISTPRPHKFENNLFQGSQSERYKDQNLNVKTFFKRNPTEFTNQEKIQTKSVPKHILKIKSNQNSPRKINLLQLTKFTIQDFNNNTIELIQKISDQSCNHSADRKANNNLFNSQGKQALFAVVH